MTVQGRLGARTLTASRLVHIERPTPAQAVGVDRVHDPL